jgi:hypothetical protein
MVTFIDYLDRFSTVWAAVMLAAVWQSTLLAILIAFATSRLQKASPAIRYWLWQIVALKLLIGSFWTILIPLPPWLPRHASNRSEYRDVSRAANASSGGSVLAAELPAMIPADGGSTGRQSPSSAGPGISLVSGLMVAWLLVVAIEVLLLFRQRARLVHLLRRSRLPVNSVSSVSRNQGWSIRQDRLSSAVYGVRGWCFPRRSPAHSGRTNSGRSCCTSWRT